jgi:hypothetical protein
LTFLVFSGEGDGPFVPGVSKVLGDDVTVKITRHGFRHDEREDLKVHYISNKKDRFTNEETKIQL